VLVVAALVQQVAHGVAQAVQGVGGDGGVDPWTSPTPTTKALGLVERSRRTSASGRGPAALASSTRKRARRSTAST
jgi:hypothetical protein